MAQLNTLNSEQKDRIDTLENRMYELEQYLRLNGIIVSGLDIKAKSYAKAAALRHDMQTSEEERITVEEEVVAFLHSKNIGTDRNSIQYLVIECSDTETALPIFAKIFSNICDKHVPIKKHNVRKIKSRLNQIPLAE